MTRDAAGTHVARPRMRAGTRAALALLAMVLASAVLAHWLAPYDPAAQLDIVALKNAPPGVAHPLGTDPFSRDVLSRLLFGARTSLLVGLLGALAAGIFATWWGLCAGWTHDRVGDAMMSVVDALRAMPRKIVLLATLLFVPHPSTVVLALLLGATSWPAMSRVVFVQTRALRARDFVASARALGAHPLRVMSRHALPHLVGTLAATSAVLVADLLAVEAGLSFLGLGVRPPEASWGSMLQDGVPYLSSAWWVVAAPCVLLVATVLCVARVADALHEGRTTR
jgi:peptide/nickel transport system permease protein